MKYDYLIVGAGLFGATFAYLASGAGKNASSLTDEHIRAAISFARISKVLMSTNTEHIYSTHPIMRYGILSPRSYLSTATLIHR